MTLLRTRRFAPLFYTQFLGALSDNLFKSALVGALAFGGLQRSGADLDVMVNGATIALVAPFFLFSALAGQLADAVDKARLARALKWTELAVMVLAGVGFVSASVSLLFLALFLMGTQSAFFGPVKYALLPQHLRPLELVAGNALVEGATFIAIVVGTLVGTLLVGLSGGAWIVSALLVISSGLGIVFARQIPPAPSASPTSLRVALRPVASVRNTLRTAKRGSIRASILGVSAFWLIGAVVLGQLPRAAERLGDGSGMLSVFLVVFSVGIGVGSFVAERFAHRLGTLAEGTVPFAAIGLGVALVFLGGGFGAVGTSIALLLAGTMGGIFVVPLYARMQRDAKKEERARVIAANNLVNAAFMVVGAGYAALRLATGGELASLFIELGIFAVLVSIVAFVMTARTALHLVFRVLIRAMYRVHCEGLERVPQSGAAVLVANHQSFVDAFVLGALIHRPMRFVMDHRMASLPVLRHFFRFAGAIPIASRRDNPEILEAAFRAIDEALDNGEVVGIFPEGRCTRDGKVDVFRPGIERILEGRDLPVVPVALEGLFGGFFSYAKGYPMTFLPRWMRSRIRVRLAHPKPSGLSAPQLRQAVVQLLERTADSSLAVDTDMEGMRSETRI